MSTHHPECEWNDETRVNRRCICPALRACEQRVKGEALAEFVGYFSERDYAAGLSAARDAVEALPKINLSRGVIATDVLSPLYVVNRDQALAAIDALRGEPA